MAIAFALLSALANAAASILERLANLTRPDGQTGWIRSGLYLLRQPLWLFGILCMTGTLVFSAVALYFGSLAIVQPVLVTELVFTLTLRQFWMRDRIPSRSWAAAAVLCVGLGTFLLAAHVEEGRAVPSAARWILATSIWAVAVLVLLGLARRGPPSRRAALTGVATGLVWSLDAAFVKSAVDILGHDGLGAVLVHWPLYAAIATGVLGTVLLQVAFSLGPLAASQPAVVITDPLTSIVLGRWLFAERVHTGPGELAVEAFGLAIMIVGIVLVSRWAPPVMTAPVRSAVDPVP